MKISDLYREIANNPKYKDINALRTVTKQLLNRARVRIQTIEGRGAKTSRYIAAVTRLREAGLLTAGGNVRTGGDILPKTDRNKILTTLRHITNFLDVADTTLKGQKRRKREQAAKAKRKKELEKKKREKERLKEKKRKEKEKKEKEKKEKKSIKERIEKEDETEEEREEKQEEQEKQEKQEENEPENETDETDEIEIETDEEDELPVIGDYWQIARDSGLLNFVHYDEFAEYVESIFDNIDITDFEQIVLDVVENDGDFWNYMIANGVDIDD